MTAPRFDAYTATTQALKASDGLQLFFPGGIKGQASWSINQGRGFHTFAERISVKDDTGSEVGSISWGGLQGERVMIEAKGEHTPGVVQRLREVAPHKCTRADSCIDVEREGAFDEYLAHVMAVKDRFKLYGERRGDWEFPELGRTQYLGANSSVVRARLYEKGRQPEYRALLRPDLVRLEIQVRPQKDAKAEYATLSAVDVWGASKWTRDLAGRVLERELEAHPPGTVRRLAEDERKLRWMSRQYGALLIGLERELGGWDNLGRTLGEMVYEERRQAERERRMLAMLGGPAKH